MIWHAQPISRAARSNHYQLPGKVNVTAIRLKLDTRANQLASSFSLIFYYCFVIQAIKSQKFKTKWFFYTTTFTSRLLDSSTSEHAMISFVIHVSIRNTWKNERTPRLQFSRSEKKTWLRRPGEKSVDKKPCKTSCRSTTENNDVTQWLQTLRKHMPK